MIKFISQNLEYPKACQENGTQGRVGVRFIVGRDGTISNVNVLKSVDPFWG
ncbi:TonB family protein [Bacteroides cellulosilyticus]|nr:TonB family protein [Bacteroides cellulosilyticus]